MTSTFPHIIVKGCKFDPAVKRSKVIIFTNMVDAIDLLIPYINLLNLSWIIKCPFLRNMDPLMYNSHINE